MRSLPALKARTKKKCFIVPALCLETSDAACLCLAAPSMPRYLYAVQIDLNICRYGCSLERLQATKEPATASAAQFLLLVVTQSQARRSLFCLLHQAESFNPSAQPLLPQGPSCSPSSTRVLRRWTSRMKIVRIGNLQRLRSAGPLRVQRSRPSVLLQASR